MTTLRSKSFWTSWKLQWLQNKITCSHFYYSEGSRSSHLFQHDSAYMWLFTFVCWQCSQLALKTSLGLELGEWLSLPPDRCHPCVSSTERWWQPSNMDAVWSACLRLLLHCPQCSGSGGVVEDVQGGTTSVLHSRARSKPQTTVWMLQNTWGGLGENDRTTVVLRMTSLLFPFKVDRFKRDFKIRKNQVKKNTAKGYSIYIQRFS